MPEAAIGYDLMRAVQTRLARARFLNSNSGLARE
jgi:hypothetical protein